MDKSNKNGWGDAREGKEVSADESVKNKFGSYKKSDVKSSKGLNGLYDEFQGKK